MERVSGRAAKDPSLWIVGSSPRGRSRPLVLVLLAACGGGGTSSLDASDRFGSSDASSDTARTGRDATMARDAVMDDGRAPLDAGEAGSYFAGCDAGCGGGCTGICSAGHCLEQVLTVTADEGIINNRAVVDGTSLYWMGGGPNDAGLNGYTIWRADKKTGAYGIVASSLDTPDAGFVVQEPVAGGFGAVFYSTVAPPSGPSQVFGVWPDAGPRSLFTLDAGFIGGLAVHDGGLFGTFSDSPPTTGSVVGFSVTGAAPTPLYANPLVGTSGIGAIAVWGTHVAWILGKSRPFAGIYVGSVDGSTPRLKIANAGDLGRSFLAMNSTHVYWFGANLTGNPSAKTTIFRAPVAGGGEEAFLVDDNIDSFAVDDTSFYWTAAHPTGVKMRPFDYSQAKTSAATIGAPKTLLACVEASGIAVDDASVYLVSAGSVVRRGK